MDFKEKLQQYIERLKNIKDSLQTEEATKMSLILPFFQILGYDVFDPLEFCPEYTADVGIKKGEKVDYAILLNGQPIFLIEAKTVGTKLDRHSAQLFRYFVATPAKFGILTNGVEYKFYTDLDETNKMDKDPFLYINLLDIKDNEINQLSKFQKQNLSVDEILDIASLLKYNSVFKNYIDKQFKNPTDEFVKLFLQPVYKGVKTQSVIEKFRPIVAKALNDYINELITNKFQSALDTPSSTPETIDNIETGEHWNFLSEVKNVLKDTLDVSKLGLKHTTSYTAVLYEQNVRKWICRLTLGTQKSLIIPDENKNEVRIPIGDISEISNYSNELIEIANRYINPPIVSQLVKPPITLEPSSPSKPSKSKYEFKPEELATLDYIKNLIGDNSIEYKKTKNDAFMYINGDEAAWICRVKVNDLWRLTLHKFENTNYEFEFDFDEVEQLEQLNEIIQEVYGLCKNY